MFATAVANHAGSLAVMAPKFLVIAVVVAVIVIAMMIYNKLHK